MTRYFLLSLAYFATGWLGLKIPYLGDHITLVWLPTGIAVAALLRWGWTVWPGIYLGAFLVNLAIGSSWPLAAGIAVGNTLGPLLAAEGLRRVGFHPAFDRQRDVGIFVAAAGLGMVLSASGGVASLYLAGLVPLAATSSAWITWWMGDTVGVLLAAPFLLTLTRENFDKLRRPRGELLLWLLISCPVAWLAFIQDYPQLGRTLPLAFLTLPLLAWAALRFGNTAATLASLGYSVLAAWGTGTGQGTFFLPDTQISLFLLWGYMATTVLTGLLITALQAERLHVEATLRESEEKLRGLFELSPLGIALTDMQGRYIDFNEAFRNICGYPAQELKDLDYWTLTPRRYEADEEQQLELLQRTGRYGPYEKSYVRKDGVEVPLQLNGMLVAGKDGQYHIWSIVEDITERKAAEAQLRRLSRVVEQSPESIVITGLDARIEYVNPAFERNTGYSRDEAIGKNPRILHSGKTPPETFKSMWSTLSSGRTWQGELYNRRKDGSDYIEFAIITPIQEADGRITHYVALKDDITKRKKIEEDLRLAKEGAEAASQAKSQFLATMSHEIRTPMNGILGMAQLLLMPDLAEEERQDYARTILNSGQTLLTLLNDILDLSKVEAGKIALERAAFDPAQVVDEVAKLFADPARRKDLRIEAAWSGPAQRYMADPIRLRQMLANLVGNAIKFTAAGFVRIEVREVERDAGEAVLEFAVVDSGIGIPEEQQQLLFEPFSQADGSTTRKYGGTGLGLSIVRQFARLMGGEVGVTSAAQQGSRFWFRIRAGIVSQGEDCRQIGREEFTAPASTSSNEALAKPRGGCILVVEDNPVNRKVIEALLKKLGIRFESVENGEEAVSAVSRGAQVNMVLMDCQMPVMDGFEATRTIRQWEQKNGLPRLPIVALTAGAFAEDRQNCLAAGMDDFVVKPVNVNVLKAMFDKWLKRQ